MGILSGAAINPTAGVLFPLHSSTAILPLIKQNHSTSTQFFSIAFSHRMSVQNLNTFGLYSPSSPLPLFRSTSDLSLDPFADAAAADPLATEEPGRQSYIHIRIQQRNGRKTLTTLQGLPKGESYI